jgi:hypothetical protein
LQAVDLHLAGERAALAARILLDFGTGQLTRDERVACRTIGRALALDEASVAVLAESSPLSLTAVSSTAASSSTSRAASVPLVAAVEPELVPGKQYAR